MFARFRAELLTEPFASLHRHTSPIYVWMKGALVGHLSAALSTRPRLKWAGETFLLCAWTLSCVGLRPTAPDTRSAEHDHLKVKVATRFPNPGHLGEGEPTPAPARNSQPGLTGAAATDDCRYACTNYGALR